LTIQTINYEWELELFEEEIDIEKGGTFHRYPADKHKEIISINKNIDYMKYNIFNAIYILYCAEFQIKDKYAFILFQFLLNNKDYFIDYIDNQFNVPKHFNINNLFFNITYLNSEEYSRKIGRKTDGLCNPAEYLIYINNDTITQAEKVFILTHECLHAIYFVLGDMKLYNNEKYINLTASILLHFIKNNKELVKLLLLKNNKEIIEAINKSTDVE